MLLSVAELARALKVSERTVRRLTAAGRIPALRVGKQLRYDLRDVTLALESGVFALRRDSDADTSSNREQQ